MTDTEALAALLHAEFITHEMGKGREDDPCDLCHQRAARLIAAGVSLRPPAPLDVERLARAVASAGVHIDVRDPFLRTEPCDSCARGVRVIAAEYAAQDARLM